MFCAQFCAQLQTYSLFARCRTTQSGYVYIHLQNYASFGVQQDRIFVYAGLHLWTKCQPWPGPNHIFCYCRPAMLPKYAHMRGGAAMIFGGVFNKIDQKHKAFLHFLLMLGWGSRNWLSLPRRCEHWGPKHDCWCVNPKAKVTHRLQSTICDCTKNCFGAFIANLSFLRANPEIFKQAFVYLHG